MIGQLHLVLRKIEDCANDVDLLEITRDWALPNVKDALGLSETFCAQFLNEFTELYSKLPRQIIHRDPNPGNIIQSDGDWWFLDFDLAEWNVRIYDPCYAATAILSECVGQCEEKWLEVYRNIIYGYDSVIRLTPEEYKAIPYVMLANQFRCVAWFSLYEKYRELYCKNKKMTLWLISHIKEIQNL